MASVRQNNPWHVGGFSSAVGIICEYGTEVNPGFGGGDEGRVRRRYNLRGYSVAGSTAVAVSTLVISLRYGETSNATLTTLALTKEPGAAMLGANDLMGISAPYMALYTSVAHADGGLVATMWGD